LQHAYAGTTIYPQRQLWNALARETHLHHHLSSAFFQLDQNAHAQSSGL
jgi:hypothetical protein